MKIRKRLQNFFKPLGVWTTDDTFYVLGMAVAVLTAAAIVLYQAYPAMFRSVLFSCPIHMLTGYYCPGCGGTRAFIHAVHGEFVDSLICHPVVLYVLVVGGLFMISQTAKRFSRGRLWGMKFRMIYLWILVGLYVVNFIVKNGLLIFWNIRIIQ
ncbi:MAG: DUF2752 domain-containing protein [Lachnospiraceae bacterium]|nr:DUF2752 domain-containing protein [Lachnospiraceae bacterium]